MKLEASANPAQAKAYKVMPGRYLVEVHWKNKTISLKTATPSEIEEVDITSAAPVYYTLQGVKVANPQSGNLYICVKDGKAKKIIF